MGLPADSTGEFPEIVEILAVVETADSPLLVAIVQRPVTATDESTLRTHPAIVERADQWQMAEETAVFLRARLEQNDLPRYRDWHERAVVHLAARLRDGRTEWESVYGAVIERLANRLLKDDPQRFVDLVAALADVPLAAPAVAQRQRFFQGAALFKAEQYDRALAVFADLLEQPELDPYVEARTRNAQAVAHRITGRPERALAGYRRSLALWRELGNRQQEGIVLMNMGIVAYQMQDYTEAEARLQQAAAIFREIDSPHWLASTQNELGILYRDQARWTEALACFGRYVAQRRREDAPDQIGRGLNNIGEVLLFQGQVTAAQTALQEALATMTTRLYQVDTHVHLGLAHQAKREWTAARDQFGRALALAEEIGRRDILPQLHLRLGECLRQMGDGPGALNRFRAGADAIEATRAPMQNERLKISLLGRWQQVYEALVLQCVVLGKTADAWLWAERARARAFAEAVLDVGGNDVATAAEVQAGLPPDGLLVCFFTIGVVAREEPLLQALVRDHPLREHLLTPPTILRFALTRDSLSVKPCVLDPNQLALASPRANPYERWLAPSVRRRLFQMLLADVAGLETADSLFIVPHGPLHQLPFAALLESTDTPPLAYGPSGTLLARHRRQRPPLHGRTSALTIGFAGAKRPLRFAEIEARYVATQTGGQALIGLEATPVQLRERAANCRLLHVACHGYFDAANPLDSYLDIGEGERLTARDVLEHWQLQADLVVLSACETAVSRVLRGDEPMGLVRAFLYAGARAVLVSQWPAPDLPAFLLMARFYEALLAGAAPAHALQVAQRWLASVSVAEVGEWDLPDVVGMALAEFDEGKRPFAHPRYWAAFILVGW